MKATLFLIDEDNAITRVREITFSSIEDVFLEIYWEIPDQVARLLRARRDPFRFSYVLSSGSDAVIFEIPFKELLPGASPLAARSAMHSIARRTVSLHSECIRATRLCRQSKILCEKSENLIAMSKKISRLDVVKMRQL